MFYEFHSGQWCWPGIGCWNIIFPKDVLCSVVLTQWTGACCHMTASCFSFGPVYKLNMVVTLNIHWFIKLSDSSNKIQCICALFCPNCLLVIFEKTASSVLFLKMSHSFCYHFFSKQVYAYLCPTVWIFLFMFFKDSSIQEKKFCDRYQVFETG